MQAIARRVILTGRVTGVGFRFATCREAGRHPGLIGFVRNADSNCVEVFVQGPADAVDALLGWLQHGPSGAQVVDVQVEPAAPRHDLTTFAIQF